MTLENTALQPILAIPERQPIRPWAIPDMDLKSGGYRARFARTRADLEAVQRLRFAVFNVELGEGLQSSYTTGRDEDQYDARCHHLMVVHEPTQRVVGTYRLMTQQMAGPAGFYSEGEFHLEALPSWITEEGVELGRACVDAEHRTGRVIYLLWRGIANYLAYNELRYLFGCCSVPGRNPGIGLKLHRQLAAEGRLMDGFIASATRPCSCLDGAMVDEDIVLPPLFKVYLDMGAKVCSEPAIDREFGVVDFLIVLDVENLDPRTRKRMFGVGLH